MHDVIQDLQKTFVRLQRAAEDVWRLVDEVSSLLPVDLSAVETNDPVKAFKEVRNVHSSTLRICDALRSFAVSWKDKTDNFAKKTENRGRDIDRTARKCGLRRLPDELLVDILDRAADSLQFRDRLSLLKSSVRLSHVCKRFRRTLVLSSKHWTGQTLRSAMPSSVILGIVERCTFRPLKAMIEFESKIRPTSNSDSIKVIMDLGARLGELELKDLSPGNSLTFSEQGHSLSPRTLACYHCLPHPSLMKNVISCSLELRRASLKLFLKSLSSADKLEVLTLRIYRFIDLDKADSMEPISLPSLTRFRLHGVSSRSAEAYQHLMGKIVPFTVSSLNYTWECPSDIGPVINLVLALPSIRDLRLELRYQHQSLPSIPQYIKRLELSGPVKETLAMWLGHPESFPMQNLRLLKLSDCLVEVSGQILRLADLFAKSGCNQVHFQFDRCLRMKNGVYELADVHRAVRD